MAKTMSIKNQLYYDMGTNGLIVGDGIAFIEDLPKIAGGGGGSGGSVTTPSDGIMYGFVNSLPAPVIARDDI